MYLGVFRKKTENHNNKTIRKRKDLKTCAKEIPEQKTIEDNDAKLP